LLVALSLLRKRLPLLLLLLLLLLLCSLPSTLHLLCVISLL